MTPQEIEKLFEGAPEGATHCYSPVPEFFKKEGGEWLVWLKNSQRWALAEIPARIAALVARPPSAWNGEGPPPVGTVCRVQDADGDWHECQIIAHHLHNAVFVPHVAYPYGVYDGLPADRFSPIRTPEQIASDERDAALKHACSVVGCHVGSRYGDVVKKLIDDGYRKQEVK